jgi:acyl dehydratase
MRGKVRENGHLHTAVNARGQLLALLLRAFRQPCAATLSSGIGVPKLYWEDFRVGHVVDYGPRSVTAEEIKAFAAEFDPQPMHLDEEAARASMIGGLCASGWHTCSIMMRIVVDGFIFDSASMGGTGVDEIKWLVPVRPGDLLRVRATVLEKRASKTRLDRGFVKFSFGVLNEPGACVMAMTTQLMFGRRRHADSA